MKAFGFNVSESSSGQLKAGTHKNNILKFTSIHYGEYVRNVSFFVAGELYLIEIWLNTKDYGKLFIGPSARIGDIIKL